MTWKRGDLVVAWLTALNGGHATRLGLVEIDRASPTRPWWFVRPLLGSSPGHREGYASPEGLLLLHASKIVRLATTADHRAHTRRAKHRAKRHDCST